MFRHCFNVSTFAVLLLMVSISSQPALSAEDPTLRQFEHAVRLADAGNSLEALKLLDWLIKKNLNDNDAILERAKLEINQDQLDKAYRDLNKVIADCPTNGYALSCRGYCYCRMAKYREAISDLTKVIDLNYVDSIDQNEGFDYVNRGKAYRALGKTELGELDLRKGAQLSLLTQARILRDQTKLSDAIDLVNGVIAKYPNQMSAIFLRGILLLNTGKYERATLDFSTIIKNKKEFSPGYFFRADAEISLQHYAAAVDDYTSIIKLNPRYAALGLTAETGRNKGRRRVSDVALVSLADIYFLRARAYRLSNLRISALADLRQAIKLRPDDQDAISDFQTLQRSENKR